MSVATRGATHDNVFKSMKDITFEQTISDQCGVTMNDSVEARAIAEFMAEKPDVIVTHPGWGDAYFLRDFFPGAKVVGLFEYYYHARGADVGFDPEFPSSFDDIFRLRVLNATQLLALDSCDEGFCPTQWQRSRFPAVWRERLGLLHDGIDTATVCPDATAQVQLPDGTTLKAGDEVLTFVSRNLEPYRGYHIFMRALRREQVERTPVWLMRQAGRYQPEYRAIRAKMSFLELCHNSQVAAEVTIMAVDMLQVDAAIIFADILLPLQSLNAGLRFAQGDGPVIDNPIRLASDVDKLSLFEIEEGLGYVFQSIRLFVKERPLVPLIGFAGAPFTLASYLIEGGSSRNFERTKAFMYLEPQAFSRLMAILTDVTIAYLLAQVAAGAHCLMLFDSWVGTLSREDYESSVLPYSKKIFAALASQAPSIHFGTATGGMLDLISSAGSTVVGVDWRMDLASAWQMIGDKAVQGNLDPTVLLGDRTLIKERTQLVLDKAAGRPGHIFNLGHGIGKDTPVDNVKYLVDLVRELSSKPRN